MGPRQTRAPCARPLAFDENLRWRRSVRSSVPSGMCGALVGLCAAPFHVRTPSAWQWQDIF